MYYLKNVLVILKNHEYIKLFGGIEEQLTKEGITVRLLGMGEKDCAADCDLHGTLWITDTAAVSDCVIGVGGAVLAYLHNNNKEESFAGVKYAFETPQNLTVAYLDRVYRRYAGIPWDILDTERCHIRESTVEDVDLFYEIYKNPSITKYMEDLYSDRNEELAYMRDYIEKVYGFYDFGVWTVIEKESGSIIGRAGLSYREGYEDPELGFVIGVPWQGKGYAYEVCREILKYGKEELGFERVQAFVETENEVSLNLCTKLGFVRMEQAVIMGKNYFRMIKNQ